jgi:hypothetical protein
MAIGDRLHRMIGVKPGSGGQDTPAIPINLGGSTPARQSDVHASDSITEQDANGLTGNDYKYPTVMNWEINGDPGKRYQDIATSHMSEGANPGRVPRPYYQRDGGKLGRQVSGSRAGTVGLDLTIVGQVGGGIAGDMYIPHTSIQRPAGRAAGSLRTIDDGAMIPGVFIADPTRR